MLFLSILIKTHAHFDIPFLRCSNVFRDRSYVFFMRGFGCAFFIIKILPMVIIMFDDVEHIDFLSYEDYKKALYYLKHKEEYDGDFVAFRDKLIEYASRDRVFPWSPDHPLYSKHKPD